MKNIIVIGGGAAGMMAAITAAEHGNHVTLFEHNEKLGKKLFITGKGRCNVTNDCDTEELLQNVVSNPKFLYSACYGFDSSACMDFFEGLGVRLKVERGNRVFPLSDHSSDIIRALEYELRRVGVKIVLNTHVKKILTEKMVMDDLAEGMKAVGVMTKDGKQHFADAVIVATGGVSYQLTGSDGSGLAMAAQLGHTVTELYPALVPLRIQESFCRDLMGLSLKNVQVTIFDGKKKKYDGFGEMLFTHYGVSGPLILSASSLVTKLVKDKQLKLYIDLKPALTSEQLDKRILRDFEEMQNKQLKNALVKLLPNRLIPVVIQQAGIDEDKNVNLITKQERAALLQSLKHLEMTVTGTADFNEAIITQGGIKVKEVNPSTMESKLVKQLYFAGECMDLDAYTGGFNLQLAWATARLAGACAAENES